MVVACCVEYINMFRTVIDTRTEYLLVNGAAETVSRNAKIDTVFHHSDSYTLCGARLDMNSGLFARVSRGMFLSHSVYYFFFQNTEPSPVAPHFCLNAVFSPLQADRWGWAVPRRKKRKKKKTCSPLRVYIPQLYFVCVPFCLRLVGQLLTFALVLGFVLTAVLEYAAPSLLHLMGATSANEAQVKEKQKTRLVCLRTKKCIRRFCYRYI